MSSDLTRLTEAAQMLAEAKTLPQIRTVHNLAQRAQEYAKAARLGLDAQNSAASIALEAEARAGELLIRLKETGERSTGRGDKRAESQPASPPPTLDDLGVTKDESSRWQAVAAIPQEERAAYVVRAQEREEEITRAGLLRHARPVVHAPAEMVITDLHRERHPASTAALETAERRARLARAINEFGKGLDALRLADFADDLDALDPTQLENLRRCVRLAGKWTDEWATAIKPRRLHVVEGAAQ